MANLGVSIDKRARAEAAVLAESEQEVKLERLEAIARGQRRD